jgi:alpha-beta hydrolase superfamily lysophospholipase
MHFTAQTSSNGVIERTFTLDDITGVLWSSASGSGGSPLLLAGHGGGMHKKAPGLVARAHHCVSTYGFAVAAIDAPGHGDRPRNTQDERWVTALREARANNQPIGSIIIEYNSSLAERAVPEWRATIDALQALPEVGTDTQIGYSGMTLATAIGLPLVASEPRIGAAVLGGILVYDSVVAAARKITVPVEYLLPWDDEVIDRQTGLTIFDALGSKEKMLHAFPGGHHEIPGILSENAARFFARHLTTTGFTIG